MSRDSIGGPSRSVIGDYAPVPVRDIDDTTARVTTALLRNFASNPSEVIHISPVTARVLIGRCMFPRQRPLNRARVNEMGRRHDAGIWDAPASTISFVVYPDRHIEVVNGQHRLAWCARGVDALETKIEVIEVRDTAHAARIYATFDERQSVRNDRELIRASDLAAELGVKERTATAYYVACPVLGNRMRFPPSGGGSYGIRAHDARLEEIRKWASTARDMEDVIDAADAAIRRRIVRGTTAAVAIYTLRYQKDIARDFWIGLALNDGLRKRDPRSTLRTDMLERTINYGDRDQGIAQSIIAWNAFYEHRQIGFIRARSGSGSVIAGTPMKDR